MSHPRCWPPTGCSLHHPSASILRNIAVLCAGGIKLCPARGAGRPHRQPHRQPHEQPQPSIRPFLSESVGGHHIPIQSGLVDQESESNHRLDPKTTNLKFAAHYNHLYCRLRNFETACFSTDARAGLQTKAATTCTRLTCIREQCAPAVLKGVPELQTPAA